MASQLLTQRENQIAEMIAWGASKKEVAYGLGISIYTVDNTLRKVYEKLHIGKLNELSAWWFCTHFNISFALSPLKRKLGAFALLALVLFSEFAMDDQFCRRTRTRTARTEIVRRAREN